MKKYFVVWFISIFVVTMFPLTSWSQDPSMVVTKSTGNLVKILSISPDNNRPLQIGDEVEFTVKIEYKIAKAPANISLIIQKSAMGSGLTDALLGSEMKVVTGLKGALTLKHKIIVPDTKAIKVFTPLLLEGEKSTSTVYMRTYKVVKKSDGNKSAAKKQ